MKEGTFDFHCKPHDIVNILGQAIVRAKEEEEEEY
jgi:hypothetical protein